MRLLHSIDYYSQSVRKQVCRPKKKEDEAASSWCNVTSTEHSGKLSVHQHPRRKGERFGFLCAASAQIDCINLQPASASFQCAKCAANDTGRVPELFLHTGLKKSGVSLEADVWSCRARHHANRHTTTTLRCHSHRRGATELALCSATMRIFRRDPCDSRLVAKPTFDPHGRWDRVLSLFTRCISWLA